MTKTAIATLLAALTLATAAAAQTDAGTKAYIDAGFAAMDANKDGKVTPDEFNRFMRARLADQAQQFDRSFAQLDASHDGFIDGSEAAAIPQLARNFAAVNADGDGRISRDELRTAAAAAQAQESGIPPR